MLKRKKLQLAVFIISSIFIFSKCLDFKKNKDPRGSEYAGSKSCINCHKDIYNSYIHTAHFLASQPADSNTIQGSFQEGTNEFRLNKKMKVVMDKRDSGFYQTGYINEKVDQSHRFDISFGGIKGQTYAYWFTNELFQLPASYKTKEKVWVNSPGYDSNRIMFERVIGIKCFNCHASYIKEEVPDVPGYYGNSEGFDKSSIVYSIDCERCHGPAASHVKFHTNNPEERNAKHIVRFISLTREQKINMCAICHSGINNHVLKASFNFDPQDSITEYLAQDFKLDYAHIDVHGNQVGLLSKSKCFLNSNMDCASCHDVHINDKSSITLYADRCTSCHKISDHNVCKLSEKLSTNILKKYCISCHMPALPSKVIVVNDTGTLIHTHRIAVYPNETKKILDYLNSHIQ